MGSTRNFELAIAECRGDIIFLCDQDDVWYPNKVKTIEAVFIDRPETGAVFTDADVVDENLQPLGSRLWKYFRFRPKEQAQVEAGDALSVLLRHPVATGATMAFRSSFRDFLLPMPPTWHDAWIALLIGTTSHLVALPAPLIAYRQHGHNQVGIPRPGRNRDKTSRTSTPRECCYMKKPGLVSWNLRNAFRWRHKEFTDLTKSLAFCVRALPYLAPVGAAYLALCVN